MAGVWAFDLPGGARLIVRTDEAAAMRLALPPGGDWERKPNLRRVLERIAGIVREGFGARFQEGGPGWAPLAPSTVASKERRGLPKRGKRGQVLRRLYQVGNAGPFAILIGTGALRDSYRQKSAKGHVERIDAVAGTVEVGSSLGYARVHQEGFAGGRRTSKRASVLARLYPEHVQASGAIPARPVYLTDRELVRIQAEVGAYLAQIAAG